MADVVRERQAPAAMDSENLSRMFGALAVLFISLFLFGLAALVATLGITIVACSEMSGQSLSWNDALGMTFDMRVLRLFGQVILQYLALGATLVLPYGMLVGGLVAKSTAVAVIGGLLFLPGICCVLFLWIRWAFALPAIAWENAGVFDSFRRSWELVQGLWWRTFGILILLTLVAQFAISIITTPLSFIALWDFFSEYFALLGTLGHQEPDSFAILEMMDSIGIGMGLLTCASAILSSLVTPLITTVMYFDLRARKGEFAQPSAQPV
jgi:hypothetical protein